MKDSLEAFTQKAIADARQSRVLEKAPIVLNALPWPDHYQRLKTEWRAAMHTTLDDLSTRTQEDIREKIAELHGDFLFDDWKAGFDRYREHRVEQFHDDYATKVASAIPFRQALREHDLSIGEFMALAGFLSLGGAVASASKGLSPAQRAVMTGINIGFWGTTIAAGALAPENSYLAAGAAATIYACASMPAMGVAEAFFEKGCRGRLALKHGSLKYTVGWSLYKNEIGNEVDSRFNAIEQAARTLYDQTRPEANKHFVAAQGEIERALVLRDIRSNEVA